MTVRIPFFGAKLAFQYIYHSKIHIIRNSTVGINRTRRNLLSRRILGDLLQYVAHFI
ncbi:unnamed protein product, partial [Nesidiocoris tenuis]